MSRLSRKLLTASAVTALAASVFAASAHHSMERFDTKQEVTVNGVITRYEWANPHVYVFIEETKENGEKVEWEIEGGPPAMMRRDGWSRQTLQPGQVVSAIGNPGRNQFKDSMYLTTMKRADETLFSEDRFMGSMMTAGRRSPLIALPTPPRGGRERALSRMPTAMSMGGHWRSRSRRSRRRSIPARSILRWRSKGRRCSMPRTSGSRMETPAVHARRAGTGHVPVAMAPTRPSS